MKSGCHLNYTSKQLALVLWFLLCLYMKSKRIFLHGLPHKTTVFVLQIASKSGQLQQGTMKFIKTFPLYSSLLELHTVYQYCSYECVS